MTLRNFLTIFPIFITAALLSSCEPAPELNVKNAYVQLSPIYDNPSTLYFDIQGGDADVELLSVNTPYALRLEMHESNSENGMAAMDQIDTVKVPAKTVVKFEPGGKHVMLWQINSHPIEIGTMEFEFAFSNGVTLRANAQIRNVNGEPVKGKEAAENYRAEMKDGADKK